MIRVIFTVLTVLLFMASMQMMFTGRIGGEFFVYEAVFPSRLIVALSLLTGGIIALYGLYWSTEDGC